ncbi:MAG: purine-nucleoside phosphorylase [Desulfobacterales bacterium]
MNEKVKAAVSFLRQRTDRRPQIGVILGSGLGGLINRIENSVSIRFEDIPHFPVSSVEGHRGEVLLGDLCGASIFVLSGRVHYYEGYTMQQVTFPVRVMAALGVLTVIMTNSAGAINESYKPGDIVSICDHLNLMGGNPLIGTPKFVNLTEAYNSEMRNLARETAGRQGMTLRSGVYAAYSGPSYETPAEIRALHAMGADLVGMSTLPEVIMANSLGMEVLGLSMITNMAAGIRSEPLSHQDVMITAEKASAGFSGLIQGIIEQLGKPK